MEEIIYRRLIKKTVGYELLEVDRFGNDRVSMVSSGTVSYLLDHSTILGSNSYVPSESGTLINYIQAQSLLTTEIKIVEGCDDGIS